MAEPDITGGGPQQMSFPGMSGASKGRSGTAARLGAKVTVDGVEKLDSKFKGLLDTLRKVRVEIQSINNGGNPVNGGVAANSSTSKLGEMIAGFQNVASSPKTAGAIGLGFMGSSVINNRMARNQAESVGISATDARLSSMYGFNYRTAEANRFNFSGSFGGSRQEQLRASTLGFSYGQTFDSNMNFMRSMGNVVQASGGTMTIGQAAESAGDFLDPITMRRASAMGITPGRVAGQVQNPLQTAMGYLDHYQRRRGVSFNEADFTNMASAGSTLRYDLKRMYGLDDSAVNQIQQAGMQNLTFRQENNRNINFNNPDDLREIGLNEDVLGLRSQQLNTAVGRRESRFFASNEAAMNRRIGQDIRIQDTLHEVENSFSALIGTLYQFENVIKGVTGAIGAVGMLGLGGALGGGGGLLGRGGGAAAGGAAGQIPGQMTLPGMGGGGAKGGGRLGGVMARGGALRMAGGVGMGLAAFQMASNTTNAAGFGSSIAMGAGAGAMIGGVPGAVVGGAVGGLVAGSNMLSAWDAGNVSGGAEGALGLDDKALIDSLKSYVSGTQGGFGGAGPKERGRFDVFTARRGALIAAVLDEASSAGMIGTDAQEAIQIGKIIKLMSDPEALKSDMVWNAGRGSVEAILAEIKSKPGGQDLYKKYFGSVSSPWAFEPIDTAQYKSLVMSNRQLTEAYITGGQSGDPVGVNTSGDGNPWTVAGGAADGRGPGHPSWDKLDNRMKGRLSQLLAASGGRVWVGEGWRDPGGSEAEFLRRHYEDPNGKREYKGKRYTLRKGEAPMAPPGQSNHNIGLAADLVGDMAWLQQNAAKFGLKTFADVNNEPWHVQLAELANGFLGNGADLGTGESNAVVGDHGYGGAMALGGGLTAASGVGYSISNAISGGFGGGGGGGFQGTAASTTAGPVQPWSGGPLSAEQVAVMAHQAGFRGQDLVDVVAIAKRESGYDPNAFNGDRSTADQSYGLMQINMLGNLGPARLQQFGISKYEDLLDPMTNLRAAFMLYQSSGNTLQPWGGYKGKENTYNTDVAAAAQAVANAGLRGDPVGGAMRPDTPSFGGGGVNINLGGIVIQSSGNAEYDADAFVRAVTPKLEEVAGMLQKRSGG